VLVIAIGAVGMASATTRRAPTTDPCSLLTRAQVASVVKGGAATPGPMTVIPSPPNGSGCEWKPTKLTDSGGVQLATIQLWDFRHTDADFEAQHGTTAKPYVHELCTQTAPAGSGVELPKTKSVEHLGDTACIARTSVSVAEGPYFLIVTAGTLRPTAAGRAAAVQLTKDALARLHD
jgi:hypothetical protein